MKLMIDDNERELVKEDRFLFFCLFFGMRTGRLAGWKLPVMYRYALEAFCDYPERK